MTGPTTDVRAFTVPIYDYASLTDLYGTQHDFLPEGVLGPDYDSDIETVELSNLDGAQGEILTATTDADEGTYEFTITQARDPRLCSYTWSAGEVPMAVLHAVYKAGYAVENVQTFPEYDAHHEQLIAIARCLSLYAQKFEEFFESLLMTANSQRCLQAVLPAEKAVRTRLVLTDAEYERLVRRLRQIIGEQTGGEPLSMSFRGPPVELVESFHSSAKKIVEKRDASVERTVSPDRLDDDPQGEVPYRADVWSETDDYKHVTLLHEDGGIARFSFGRVEEGAETYTPLQLVREQPPHQSAVNALFQQGVTVQGHRDLTPPFGDRLLDQVEDIIALIDAIEARFAEMDDGNSIAAMAVGMTTPVLEDLRMSAAYYEELGTERFQEVEQHAHEEYYETEMEPPDIWPRFTAALDDLEPDFLDSASPRLQRVLDDREQKNTRGEMIPQYTLGSEPE